MTTPARQHFLRASAAKASAAAAPGATMADTTVYEQQLAQLIEHRRRLKAVQSIERKVALKRELLPEYAAYVQGALEGGKGAQDDVLMTVMVWRIDVGDIAGALDIAEYALAHNLTLPDQYERDTATLVAEEIAEAALRQGGEVGVEDLERAQAAVADRDMPDEVRAKLHKALGYAERESDPEQALLHLRRALSLSERCGVKKDIERLERELKHAGTSG